MKQTQDILRAFDDLMRNRFRVLVEKIDTDTVLRKEGDASKVINFFSSYEKMELPESGEELGITIGKIRKYLWNLYDVAFSGSYRDLRHKPIKFYTYYYDEAVSAAYSRVLDEYTIGGENGSVMKGKNANACLIYGHGGVATAAKLGTTDFMLAYLAFYKKADSATGAGAGWGLIQLGKSGDTARWSIKSTLTTASSQKESLVVTTAKGAWSQVNVLLLPGDDFYVS